MQCEDVLSSLQMELQYYPLALPPPCYKRIALLDRKRRKRISIFFFFWKRSVYCYSFIVNIARTYKRRVAIAAAVLYHHTYNSSYGEKSLKMHLELKVW